MRRISPGRNDHGERSTYSSIVESSPSTSRMIVGAIHFVSTFA